MKHREVTALLLRHEYYADGRCPDFAIKPCAETARLLRNHRCLCGTSSDGVRILTQCNAMGQPFLPLPAEVTLRFELRLQNREFALFTDLTGLGRGAAVPQFINAGAAAGDAPELQLATGAPERRRSAPEVFAEVELRLTAVDRAATPPPPFYVSFRAKRTRWAYYCVTDLASDPAELHIVDSAPGMPTDLLLFSAANRTQLDEQPDAADPIAVQLASQYPALRRLRLISDQTVACRQQPRKHLELRLGSERLAGPLPNPALRNAAREDLLFQVIKYRTQPFQNP